LVALLRTPFLVGIKVAFSRGCDRVHTGAGLLTNKQTRRLSALFATERDEEVKATGCVYQRVIGPDRTRGRDLMEKLITSVSTGVPAALVEVITLGRMLKQRAADILGSFDDPGTSNGPTEAINGRLAHLHGSALGIRNTHELHRQITTGDRQIKTPTTPSIG
jgi:transposase